MSEQNADEKWVTIGLDPETYARLEKKAKESHRSLVGQLRWFLDEDDARKLYGSIAERAASLS